MVFNLWPENVGSGVRVPFCGRVRFSPILHGLVAVVVIKWLQWMRVSCAGTDEHGRGFTIGQIGLVL